MQCLFGQDTCDYVPGLRGFSFVFTYTLAYIGGGLLLRYAEGATYLAIVQVTKHKCTEQYNSIISISVVI